MSVLAYIPPLSLSKAAWSFLKNETLLEWLSHTTIRTKNPQSCNIFIKAKILSFSQSVSTFVSERHFTIYGILAFKQLSKN